MAFLDDLTTLETRETELVNNKVSRFAYTSEAYANNDASGVETYDPEADNNIPIAVASVMRVNDTIIDKGWRSQASSLTRMLMNHFLGRTSYNLNKVNDNFKTFLTSLKGALGTASGIATLNADGKLNLSQFTPMTEITWASLKSLRDDGELVSGHYYRITDYVTTTVQTDTQSAGHAFDVIVRADSATALNENAFAIQHEGDAYFASSNLSAWKLKYCLDNDATRFAWADTTNGKGVIYCMIDEWENDLPYDFKNIQFKRWKVTQYLMNGAVWATPLTSINSAIASTPSLRWGNVTNDSAEDAIDDNGSTWWASPTTSVTLSTSDVGWWKVDEEYDMFVKSDGTSKWFYTFSNLSSDSADATDSSLLGGVFKNKLGYGQKSNNVVSLGKNVFIGNSCDSNTFGNNCDSNTFGNSCDFNTFGNSCYSNTFGNSCYSNTFGNSCYFNTFGNNCDSNTFGNSCDSNTFGNSCGSNTFGNDYVKWNRFGDGCKYIEFSAVSGGSSSNYIQKYDFLEGTGNLSGNTKISMTLSRGNWQTNFVKNDSANTLTVVVA